jgi:thioredoxin 1
MSVAEFTDSNFETEVLQSDQPVLVDFWATWCAPCRALTPVIHELGDENAGKAKVGKLDIDSNPDTATKYRIESIPTLIVFHNGEIVAKLQGQQPKVRLQQAIDSAVS